MLALVNPSGVSFNMEVVDVAVQRYHPMVGCRSQGIGSKLRAGEGTAGRPTHG